MLNYEYSPFHNVERYYDMRDEYRIDYHGNRFYPYMYDSYRQCKACGQYVWKNRLPLGMCSYCVFKLPEFILVATFTKPASKHFKKRSQYNKALKQAMTLPNYMELMDRHYVWFEDVEGFFKTRHAAYELALLFPWKSFQVTLNDEQIDRYHISTMSHDMDRIAYYSRESFADCLRLWGVSVGKE